MKKIAFILCFMIIFSFQVANAYENKSIYCSNGIKAVLIDDGSLYLWGESATKKSASTRTDLNIKDLGLGKSPKKILDNVEYFSIGHYSSSDIIINVHTKDGSLLIKDPVRDNINLSNAVKDNNGFYKINDSKIKCYLHPGHDIFINKENQLYYEGKVSGTDIDICLAGIYLKTDGSVWGSELTFGEIDGMITEEVLGDTYRKIADNVKEISYVYGIDHIAMLKNDGSLWIIGMNIEGCFGNGSDGIIRKQGPSSPNYEESVYLTPVKVMDNVSKVSCGIDFTAVVKNDGTLWMFGQNEFGLIYNNSKKIVSTPEKIMDDCYDVATSGREVLVLKNDGSVYYWASSNNEPQKIMDNGKIADNKAKETNTRKYSDWAEEELNKAKNMELIPSILEDEDLTQNITRKEFAYVAVKLYEKISKKDAKSVSENPFTDTNDKEILKAYSLGITKGTSDTTFEPNVLITREQMATMMTRALKEAGINTSVDIEKVAKFADDNEMHSWGKESIYYMSDIEIIKGIGDNKFGVTGNATREQALLICQRSAEKFAK